MYVGYNIVWVSASFTHPLHGQDALAMVKSVESILDPKAANASQNDYHRALVLPSREPRSHLSASLLQLTAVFVSF
jgi:hypothetical protein